MFNTFTFNTTLFNSAGGPAGPAPFTLTIPTSIIVAAPLTLTIPTNITVGTDFTVMYAPISGMYVPASITVYDLPLTLSIATLFNVVTPAPISFGTSIEVTSVQFQLSFGTYFNVVTPAPLAFGTSFEVKEPWFQLVIGTQFKVYDSVLLTIATQFEIFTPIASGVGGQAVGEVVQLPTNNLQDWSYKVVLNNADVSARLTGTLNIDAEESAAMVAVFQLVPTTGYVDPYTWVKKPVRIYHVRRDSSGNVVASYLLFSGIVDTPNYDTSSGIVEFTCTDNLQNVVRGMTQASVAAATPLATYSEFVFDPLVNAWDYLQDRASTYPYAYKLNLNGQLQVYDYRATAILYEFTSATIIDGSLSVSLANARDITNYITVNADAQYDKYRETVIGMHWQDQKAVDDLYPDWLICNMQMVLDAVQGTGATFVTDPLMKSQLPSHGVNAGASWVYINPGDGLGCNEALCGFSKRYRQSINETQQVVVKSSASIASLGTLPDERSASISVEYNSGVDTGFEKTQDNTKWFCSAGTAYQTGRDTAAPYYTDPMLLIEAADGSVGYSTYPRYSVTYTSWYSEGTLFGGNIHSHKYRVDDNDNPIAVDASFGTPGMASPGEYLYDFDDYINVGKQAERDLMLDTLAAQAQTSILASHRETRVSFSTFLTPFLDRGMTLRVDTDRLKAQGVIRQLIHSYDVAAGTAKTSVTLAISLSEAVGIPDANPILLKLTIPTSIVVSDGAVGSNIPMNKTSMDYYLNLSSFYTGDALAGYSFDAFNWGGFFTRTTGEGDHAFALEFPALPVQNTENATIVVDNGTIEVLVPHNEFLLSA